MAPKNMPADTKMLRIDRFHIKGNTVHMDRYNATGSMRDFFLHTVTEGQMYYNLGWTGAMPRK